MQQVQRLRSQNWEVGTMPYAQAESLEGMARENGHWSLKINLLILLWNAGSL